MIKKKILLFEDDQQLIELIRIIFRKGDYGFSYRDRCLDVIQDVEMETPDLILMDIRIPELGGVEATRILKSDLRSKMIPVILISADPKTREKAEEAGADDYIVKPFDIEMLENKITGYLK